MSRARRSVITICIPFGKTKKQTVKIKMMQNMSKVIRTFVFKLKCLGGGNCLLDFKQPKESSKSVNICSKE